MIRILERILNLSFKQMWQISRQPNCWDRDVLLKSALSVPSEVFTSWEHLAVISTNNDIQGEQD